MNIAYCTDENYVRHVAVSMLSVFENNREISDINIYVIVHNVSEKSKKELGRICEMFKRTLTFVDFGRWIDELNTDKTFSLLAFARLFLSRLEVDKILYLDCDTVVNGRLEPLYTENIDHVYASAVQDTVAAYYKTSLGMEIEDIYFNSGVMCFNLKKWREDAIEQKFMNVIEKFHGSVPHHDQGVINAVFRGRIKRLDPKYNLMGTMLHYNSYKIQELYLSEYYSDDELEIARNQPVIIHFTADFYNRPWSKYCTHPYKNLYVDYLNQTKWKDSLSDERQNKKVVFLKTMYRLLPFPLYKKLLNLIEKMKH